MPFFKNKDTVIQTRAGQREQHLGAKPCAGHSGVTHLNLMQINNCTQILKFVIN